MTRSEALKALERVGTAQNRKIYARHGVRSPMFGVSKTPDAVAYIPNAAAHHRAKKTKKPSRPSARRRSTAKTPRA